MTLHINQKNQLIVQILGYLRFNGILNEIFNSVYNKYSFMPNDSYADLSSEYEIESVSNNENNSENNNNSNTNTSSNIET